MLKKTITYEDFNGVERTEDHYFNLKSDEVIKWLTTTGDYTLDKVVDRLCTERNGKKIMEIMEDLIHMSYGRKSLDGRRFEKSEEIWKEFYETEAYSVLFTELVTSGQAAAAFVNAIIPDKLSKEISRIVKENPNGVPVELRDYLPMA